MGRGLAPINDAAIEAGRILRKVERRLKTLLASKRAKDSTIGPRTPLVSPKQLLSTLSNKATPFLQRKKTAEEEKPDAGAYGGLWQKEILMGEKCQPLDFSGVIYYNTDGKLLSGIPPRSPRGNTPLAQSFSFPVSLAPKDDGY